MRKRFFIRLLVLLLGYASQAQMGVMSTADSLYGHGNFTKAIYVYKTLEDQDLVADKIAKSYLAIGNYDAALNYYKQRVEAHPDDALSIYEYAKLLSRTKHYEASIAQFNTLMNIDFRNPNYHYEMGLALDRMDDSTAIDRFIAAYKLDDTHQKAIFKIGKYYLKKRKHEIANQYIDKGLESYANNLELISLKAQNYYYHYDYKNAQIWFEKLLEMGESSEFIHEKLSMVYAEFSEFEKAIEQRKLALKFNPLDATALFVIGTYYEKLEDFATAESYIQQSLKLKDVPLDFEYQKLGFVLNRQNKFKEAIKAFQTSIKEDPENVASEFYLLITKDKYYADYDAKVKLYEDFLKKHQDAMFSEFAKKRLKELKDERFMKE
ncbi:tetratricopeptide repeat protein [Subsaximicrobium wynnwilliamsii]|uniref:Tetratricopeptide repeat protein n=1 Tax=Subsaximicrobium wynnwilliamsii TaxID=291179 RepID=A0A5C6ZH78_9FLAO|nr:tetratricopeptide repeat protein [Subsaximicrobium wynnwilliamsii]TXD82592.1 tetratricopeptide repeat protein [Subsaximicrobium wynnwilliamsii]TXD88235.1 tetratricopeptide repeat protein [Subsaximicrobium wynnwilliamsii]TXE02250.1 tetratricopeptide repeat protein [Subsaximicrobium wynnwilliamsii]